MSSSPFILAHNVITITIIIKKKLVFIVHIYYTTGVYYLNENGNPRVAIGV